MYIKHECNSYIPYYLKLSKQNQNNNNDNDKNNKTSNNKGKWDIHLSCSLVTCGFAHIFKMNLQLKVFISVQPLCFWARVILLLHTYYYWFALMTCGIFKHLCAYGVSRYLYLLWVFFSGCMQMGGWILKWGMGFRAAAIMGGVWNSAIFNFYFSAVSFKYRGSFGFGGILGARLKSTKFWDFPDFS